MPIGSGEARRSSDTELDAESIGPFAEELAAFLSEAVLDDVFTFLAVYVPIERSTVTLPAPSILKLLRNLVLLKR